MQITIVFLLRQLLIRVKYCMCILLRLKMGLFFTIFVGYTFSS